LLSDIIGASVGCWGASVSAIGGSVSTGAGVSTISSVGAGAAGPAHAASKKVNNTSADSQVKELRFIFILLIFFDLSRGEG
jgi:hypothetical protein